MLLSRLGASSTHEERDGAGGFSIFSGLNPSLDVGNPDPATRPNDGSKRYARATPSCSLFWSAFVYGGGGVSLRALRKSYTSMGDEVVSLGPNASSDEGDCRSSDSVSRGMIFGNSHAMSEDSIN